MDKYVILFIKTSLISLLVGSALGVDMAIRPGHVIYFYNAHVHLNLLGFMAMMIYGVGYHVLPRFSGVTLHSKALMVVHYYLAAVTLGVMALCWIGLEVTSCVGPLRGGLMVSGSAHFLSMALFVYNIFRSIKPVVYVIPPPQKEQPQT